MSDSAIFQKARAAETLLADETFRTVIDDLRQGAINQWRATASGAPSLREILWNQVSALDAIEAELAKRIDDAKHEQRRLELTERREATAATSIFGQRHSRK